MEKRKNIHYPEIKRFTNSGWVRGVKPRPIPDEVLALIENNKEVYDILAPFFLERANDKREKSYEYNKKLTEQKRKENTELFFSSLTAEQLEKFLVFREQYNKLFDEEKYAEAHIIKRRFQQWLAHNRKPIEERVKHYMLHRDEILAKSKAKTIALNNSATVECNLCGMILDNNNPQRRRHSIWHSKAQVQGRNTTQGRVSWKVPEK
jgi:hypothetical protein